MFPIVSGILGTNVGVPLISEVAFEFMFIRCAMRNQGIRDDTTAFWRLARMTLVPNSDEGISGSAEVPNRSICFATSVQRMLQRSIGRQDVSLPRPECSAWPRERLICSEVETLFINW
jgi:hypothetical protein